MMTGDQSDLDPPPSSPREDGSAAAYEQRSIWRQPWVWVLIGMGGVIGLADLGAFSNTDTSTHRSTDRTVTYNAIGSAGAGNITYETPSGSEHESNVRIPLEPVGTPDGTYQGITYYFKPGHSLYMSVQNGTDSGSVTCTIDVDGSVIAENTANGAGAIATCDGQS
jgi:hypothetical protein